MAATVALAFTGATGCGSDGGDATPDTAPARLTAQERAAAREGHAAIRAYCRRLGLYLAGRRSRPPAEAERRALAGARALAALARRKPAAPFGPGQTVRQLAGDTAEDLEGTNCSARLVTELEAGL